MTEKEILKFWKENKIFEKSLRQRQGKNFYSFFDGPPFATGLPHYGHILASTIKGAIMYLDAGVGTAMGYQLKILLRRSWAFLAKKK